MSVEQVRKLIALATNAASPLEERRTAALIAVEKIAKEKIDLSGGAPPKARKTPTRETHEAHTRPEPSPGDTEWYPFRGDPFFADIFGADFARTYQAAREAAAKQREAAEEFRRRGDEEIRRRRRESQQERSAGKDDGYAAWEARIVEEMKRSAEERFRVGVHQKPTPSRGDGFKDAAGSRAASQRYSLDMCVKCRTLYRPELEQCPTCGEASHVDRNVAEGENYYRASARWAREASEREYANARRLDEERRDRQAEDDDDEARRARDAYEKEREQKRADDAERAFKKARAEGRASEATSRSRRWGF